MAKSSACRSFPQPPAAPSGPASTVLACPQIGPERKTLALYRVPDGQVGGPIRCPRERTWGGVRMDAFWRSPNGPQITIYDLDGRQEVRTLSVGDPDASFQSVSFSPRWALVCRSGADAESTSGRRPPGPTRRRSATRGRFVSCGSIQPPWQPARRRRRRAGRRSGTFASRPSFEECEENQMNEPDRLPDDCLERVRRPHARPRSPRASSACPGFRATRYRLPGRGLRIEETNRSSWLLRDRPCPAFRA